jgi:hypothetical protein
MILNASLSTDPDNVTAPLNFTWICPQEVNPILCQSFVILTQTGKGINHTGAVL